MEVKEHMQCFALVINADWLEIHYDSLRDGLLFPLKSLEF